MGKRMEAAALLSEGGMLIIWKFVDLFAKEFGTSKKDSLKSTVVGEGRENLTNSLGLRFRD